MVAGGLTLGIPGVAAAESVGFTVLPSGDGVYPPRPISVETVVDPGTVAPAVQENEPVAAQPVHISDNNNGFWWPNNNWQGWSWPQVSTNNDTKNGNAQPIVAPGGTGAGGIAPVQNAAQQAQGEPAQAVAPEEAAEDESEEVPGEEAEEEHADENEDMPGEEESEDTSDEESGPPAGEAPMAGGPAQAAGGGRLPFTGAPASVAVAGAGLLAVALGCTLLSARRRRSGDAE
ncbi:hypothetical protein [Microbispora triticiradicis]|uniref:hypothetical protein n=1 Tax=Microbispora triticiradicis TaxID=2200763 RepID=UPI001AD79FC1|nr:hypothetical protein [Microbispora triticiradicis]MBO4271540.1 hypothetical protein [Microbispora triticiradicis]